MCYHTIVVHADLSRHAPTRYALAAQLARSHGAALLGAAMTGVARQVVPSERQFPLHSLEEQCFAPLDNAARRALAQFSSVALEYGVRGETRLVRDRVEDALVTLARTSDLVILSQDDPDEALGPQALPLPDYVIAGAARPVLVVPGTPWRGTPFAKILLAWDGSREAAAAINAALPLLQRAACVTVASFEPGPPRQDDWRQPIAELSRWLARHGVQTDVALRGHAPEAGRALLALAADAGSDLLVMGCYGHSRFHELVRGGASRTVLREATLPVLMAH
jgi:nucleotide-binding universal stress UspA family protein